MTELIIRSVQLEAVELEGADGRTLHSRLLRWDEVSQVQDPGGRAPYGEAWKRGVFSQSIRRSMNIKRGWPLMFNHKVNEMPLGMVSAVHEREDGPWMTAKISRTRFGDDIIELINDGAIPGVSIHGRNIKSRRRQDGVIERMEVALTEISVTPFPSLVGADEMVLRSLDQDIDRVEDTEDQYVEGSRQRLHDFLAGLDDPLPIEVVSSD